MHELFLFFILSIPISLFHSEFHIRKCLISPEKMVRASNFVVGLLNVFVVLVSLAGIGASVYFHVHGSPTSCQKSLQDPLLIAGVALLAVSLMAVVGACCGVNWLLRLYLALMLVLIVALVALAAFLFLVTNKGAGKAVSGRGYKEYRLGDYSHWLRNHVASGKRWREIKSCLAEGNVCRSLAADGAGREAAQFFKMNWSPIQVMWMSFCRARCSCLSLFLWCASKKIKVVP